MVPTHFEMTLGREKRQSPLEFVVKRRHERVWFTRFSFGFLRGGVAIASISNDKTNKCSNERGRQKNGM